MRSTCCSDRGCAMPVMAGGTRDDDGRIAPIGDLRQILMVDRQDHAKHLARLPLAEQGIGDEIVGREVRRLVAHVTIRAPDTEGARKPGHGIDERADGDVGWQHLDVLKALGRPLRLRERRGQRAKRHGIRDRGVCTRRGSRRPGARWRSSRMAIPSSSTSRRDDCTSTSPIRAAAPARIVATSGAGLRARLLQALLRPRHASGSRRGSRLPGGQERRASAARLPLAHQEAVRLATLSRTSGSAVHWPFRAVRVARTAGPRQSYPPTFDLRRRLAANTCVLVDVS
jgi:hypothetical protein